MLTTRFALRATPPDPGTVAWLDRERECIADALALAHGMQGAPGWDSFVDVFLHRLERDYQGEKPTLVRDTWRTERSLTVDEFEWGIDETIRRDEIDGELTCDICDHRQWAVEVHDSGQ